MAKPITKRPTVRTAKAVGRPLNTKGAFVCYMDQSKIDFAQFPRVAGDVKGKATFDELTGHLNGNSPIRLRIGRSSKAIAIKPSVVGVSARVSETAKLISTATFRKDPLAWINFAVARQHPLGVGEGKDHFLVLPRVDIRFCDDLIAQPSHLAEPSQLDGLGGAILAVADRLSRVPALADDASGIAVSMKALRNDIQTLVGEIRILSGEFKSATGAMHVFADQVGSINRDVMLAVGVSG